MMIGGLWEVRVCREFQIEHALSTQASVSRESDHPTSPASLRTGGNAPPMANEMELSPARATFEPHALASRPLALPGISPTTCPSRPDSSDYAS